MPAQTVNPMSRTQCAAVMIYFSSVKVKWSSFTHFCRMTSGSQLATTFASLSTRQCFGETYPVFFCIYLYIHLKEKSGLRLPLVKHATSLNDSHASDCVIQSHNRRAASSCLSCCEARFVCGFYIFPPSRVLLGHFHMSK